jgi:purine-binding chemotaxis protein CheW
MTANAYAIFSLHETLYGIQASAVCEVFYLPELTPVSEAPSDVVGVINLRGVILPIIDLDIRFGRAYSGDYQLTQCIVVIQSQGHSLGIIVDSVRDVLIIEDTDIEQDLTFGRMIDPVVVSGNASEQHNHRLIWGLARLSTETITLLDPDVAIYQSSCFEWNLFEDADHQPLSEDIPDPPSVRERSRHFCPHATPADLAIFQERAVRLRSRPTDQQDTRESIALAVVGMGSECIAVPLQSTCEFVQVRKVSPVPCCPTYVVGNMNLRGEIITLLNLCSVLDISTAQASSARMAVVVDVNGIVAGLLVESVLDIVHVFHQDIAPVPEAIHNNGREYLRGVIPYETQAIGILNLEKVFLQGNLIIDEVIV